VSSPPELVVPTVSVMVVRPVVLTLERLGVDVPTLLSRAGLSAEQLRDKQARIPMERELALWRAADELVREPGLGLRVARHFELGVLGSLGYLLRHSENLEALVARAQRYWRLMDDLAQVGLVVEGDEARLTFARAGNYPVPPSGLECLFSVAFRVGHGMWPGAYARSVHFAHKLRGPLAPYRARFGCPVFFEAEAYAIAFDAAWSRAPAHDADPKLARVLETHTEHLLAQLPRAQGFVDLAREALRALLGARAFGPDALAHALHISERTLRRRLQQENTSYRALLDEVRHALALTLVGRVDLSLEQAAQQLGFAEPSTFYKAFKRWTGTTPAQYQRRHKP
jgi:AraC-like DNA-binding protein